MTKLVKNGIPSRFITGDDVITSKGTKYLKENEIVPTVDNVIDGIDDTLDKHQKEIDKLKSNVKYIYSYGGVGGNGSGGSGGGGSDSNLSFFVSLDGHPVQSDSTNPIILNNPGVYTISGSIRNSNGKLFYVKADTADKFSTSKPLPLSTELNRCTFSKSLNLTKNGEIQVEFYDSEMIQLFGARQNYIVNPHIFDMKFMYKFDNGSGTPIDVEFNPYEYFIGDSAYTDPFIDATFKIDIPNVTNVSLTYSIGDTDVIEEDEDYVSGQGIKDYQSTTDISTNHFKIPLGQLKRGGIDFVDDDNTGTYTVTMTLKYSVNANEVTDTKSFTMTLIPNHLYINVKNPQGILYDTLEDLLEDTEDDIPNKSLNVGTYTPFYCKIFEGTIRTDKKKYTLNFKAYDDSEESEYMFDDLAFDPIEVTGVEEQTEMENPISVAFGSPGIKMLVFSTVGQKPDIPDGEPTVKYIYVKETKSEIDWYPSDLIQDTYYFRANSGNDSYSLHFPNPGFSGNSPWTLSESDSPITLIDEFWHNPSSGRDTTILSFGIQYSAINVDGAEILKTYSSVDASVADIVLYSDKFYSKKICIPAENNFDITVNDQYHLVQIVRHKIGYSGETGTTPQYATYLYIDGKLESNSSTLNTNQLFVSKIVLNGVNVIYNLINLQYVSLNVPGESSNSHTIDEIIYQYHLAYKSIMQRKKISDAEKIIFNNVSSIKFDGKDVIVDSSFVETIAPKMPIPTMMMEYTNNDPEKLREFKANLFKGYKDRDVISFGQHPISLYWCKPGIDTTLYQVKIPTLIDGSDTYSGEWKVELQGTSTMKNKIKNFSLILDTTNTTGTKKLLMSPNYSSNDSTTFLPEQIWTLKADIADSAHANNTSIGKFVNETCTKFSTTNGSGLGDVGNYVKNTLEGFPYLMYFKIGLEVYYLGVYNFNMGRQSYYNLGYLKREDMLDMISHIQTTSSFAYSVGSNAFIDGLAIGEVQDNNPEFDFHQYDNTVLFSGDVTSNSRATMFGPDSKITATDIGLGKTTLSNFVKIVSRAGAYCFANIGKKPVSSKSNDSTACVNRYKVDENGNEEVPDIHYQFKYDGTSRIWEATGPEFDDLKMDIENLMRCIFDYEFDGTEHPLDYHYLDYTSASEYYTICMAFGLVDSILKNMNIKSWDAKKCYIAFYDMDCALGENNMGIEDVSYLAATDYWHSDTSLGYVDQVTINYDCWDDVSGGKGFDFPSSYLFAIAKYAQPILQKQGRTLTNYPQQFWAKIRANQLLNADEFVKNYFSSGIGQIPAYMASLNYQVKYLYYGTYIDANNVERTNFIANEAAFNGTRIEKVKDWLNKRLHFLDVVFNVQNMILPIGGGYNMPAADSSILATLSNNTDVVILSDAFSDENNANALMTSHDIPVEVKAPINTPFIHNRGGSYEIYMLGAATGTPNYIKVNTTLSQASRFLGSKAFTNLNKIEPFLTTGFRIDSNNLEEIIYGESDFPQYNTTLTVVSRSVKRIQLNIPKLSGILDINYNNLNGQALHSLDVSNSGLVGSWKNLKNLKSLNISSVNNLDDEGISVAECPLEGMNCSISGTEENPTTLRKLELLGVSGTFQLRNTHIQEIHFEVSSKDNNASFDIDGDTLLQTLNLSGFKYISIKNCPNLHTLTIDEPQDGCICEQIILDTPESYTPSDGSERKYLYSLNSTRNGVFDFTKYSKLKTLSVSGFEKVEVIKIPNRKVSVITFRDNGNLEFVDTIGENSVIELTGGSTFYKSPRYGMRQSWYGDNGVNIIDDAAANPNRVKKGVYTKICVSSGTNGQEICTTLEDTFNKNSNTKSKYLTDAYVNDFGQKVKNDNIYISEADTFLNKCVRGIADDIYISDDNIIHNINDLNPTSTKHYGDDCRGNIESLQRCFQYQESISYDGTRSVPNMSTYTSLNNIAGMYKGTDIRYFSEKLLSLPDVNNNNDEENRLYWSEFVGTSSIRISQDAFKHISYRIPGFERFIFTVCDPNNHNIVLNTSSSDGYLDVVSILCPQKDEYDNDIPFERITYFETFSINPSQYVDYRRLFEVCPNVETLTGFLNSDLSKAKIGGMLKHCTKLKNIYESFCHSGIGVSDLEPIDLYEFFNWGDDSEDENLFDIERLFSSGTYKLPGFKLNKYISQEHFKDIMGVLHNFTNISSLTNIFSYCTITDYDPDYEIKFEDDLPNVTSINSLFYNCKYAGGYPLKIRRSFFEHLPNVTSLANTFGETYLDHIPSYDFFCKRIDTSEPETVYVKIDNRYVWDAKLYTTKYSSSLIDNMYGCFSNVKFKNCKAWFDPNDDVNIGLEPVGDTVIYDGNSYDTYYKDMGSIKVEYKINEPYAITDTINNFTNYVPSVIETSTGIKIDNHNISQDLNIYNNVAPGIQPFVENDFNIYPTYCCLPPDLLYGCHYTCDLTDVFANTNIIGVIPQHFLMKCYGGLIQNVFKNVNILPNLMYHSEKNLTNYTSEDPDYASKYQRHQDYLALIEDIPIDNSIIENSTEEDSNTYTLSENETVLFRDSNGVLKKRKAIIAVQSGDNTLLDYSKSQFTYIPQGYTTNPDLSNAFNFRYNLPQQVKLSRTDLLSKYNIVWAEGDYNDKSYSPDSNPAKWPYYTQYFFMVDDSVSWSTLNYMNTPFILNEQDTDFFDGSQRVFSSGNESVKNKWWGIQEDILPARWNQYTNGILNVFLNLCGKRSARTGQIKDNGCLINSAMKRNPYLDSFITGILVTFLSGKVFDDLDGGRFTASNGGTLIRYDTGFSRNIILPEINYISPAGVAQHPRVILGGFESNTEYTWFYDLIFPTNSSLENYKSIFGIRNYIHTGIRYKVLA